MIAYLIQSLYNIVDSYFIGKYSGDGLTALSVIYPIQLIISAVAVGTGVGVNTYMSRQYSMGRNDDANYAAGTGMVIAVISWAVLSVLALLFLRPYVEISTTSSMAIEYGVSYGLIVCVGSLAIFLESLWTKVHQAGGNMWLPMIAQVLGALTNIVLDPVLIFGWGGLEGMGITGAAMATVIGQIVAAVITGVGGLRKPPAISRIMEYVKQIYRLGFASIFMQLMFTVYIIALNLILSSFSDKAVTVLGLYYKVQSFFFIPLMGLQICIVPVISFNYARDDYKRCKEVIEKSAIIAMAFMVVGVLCFELIPGTLIGIFSKDLGVLEIGIVAFRIIGISFIPAVLSLIMPVFFQAIGFAKPIILLSFTRQIFCLIPIFWLFSKVGLNYVWIAFPAAEIITGALGLFLYKRQLKSWW